MYNLVTLPQWELQEDAHGHPLAEVLFIPGKGITAYVVQHTLNINMAYILGNKPPGERFYEYTYKYVKYEKEFSVYNQAKYWSETMSYLI